MVNFRRLSDRAKKVVDKRGGTGALKEDMSELKDIAKGKGSLKDKAKAAKDAVKDPGAKDPETGGAEAVGAQRPQPPAQHERAEGAPERPGEPGGRSK